jgi:hypothetical protein
VHQPSSPFPVQDIPRVLATIRREWATAGSLNQQTAGALLSMLQEKAAAMGDAPHDGSTRKEIDVLVTAVESSLWVGEQFAADLQNCEPRKRPPSRLLGACCSRSRLRVWS